MSQCDRHEDVIKDLEDHEKRIQTLEKADVQMAEQIKNLIEKMDGLMGWIKALVVVTAGGMLGFLFSYIQSLK